MKIKDLCEDERPREKMYSHGAAALSSGELIAILLRTGNSTQSAVEVAQNLLSSAGGSLVSLSEMTIETLTGANGIGKGKASSLMACFELGRRLFSEKSAVSKAAVTSPKMVYELMIPRLLGVRHEECWVLFLNNAQYCLSCSRLTSGGQSATIIDVKEILRTALEKRAAFIVLVHNHPSGNPRPSMEDIKQTSALKKALSTFGIGLMDHVIICDDSFYSFSDESVGTVHR